MTDVDTDPELAPIDSIGGWIALVATAFLAAMLSMVGLLGLLGTLAWLTLNSRP